MINKKARQFIIVIIILFIFLSINSSVYAYSPNNIVSPKLPKIPPMEILNKMFQKAGTSGVMDMAQGFKGVLVQSIRGTYYLYVYKPNSGEVTLLKYNGSSWDTVKTLKTVKGFEKPGIVDKYKYAAWNDYSDNSAVSSQYDVVKNVSESGSIALFNPSQANLTTDNKLLKTSADDFYKDFSKKNHKLTLAPNINIPKGKSYSLAPFVLVLNNISGSFTAAWQFTPSPLHIYYNTDKTAVWGLFDHSGIYNVTVKVTDNSGSSSIVSGKINIMVPNFKVRVAISPVIYLYKEVWYAGRDNENAFINGTRGLPIYKPINWFSSKGKIAFAIETPGKYRIEKFTVNGVDMSHQISYKNGGQAYLNKWYTVTTSKSYIYGVDGNDMNQAYINGSGAFWAYGLGNINNLPLGKDVLCDIVIVNSSGVKKEIKAKTKFYVAMPILYGYSAHYTTQTATVRTTKVYNFVVSSDKIDPKTGKETISFYAFNLKTNKNYNSIKDIENDPEAMKQIKEFYADPPAKATKQASQTFDHIQTNALAVDTQTRSKVLLNPIEDRNMNLWTNDLMNGIKKTGGNFVTGAVEVTPVVDPKTHSTIYKPAYKTQTTTNVWNDYHVDYFGSYTTSFSAANFEKDGVHEYYKWNPYEVKYYKENVSIKIHPSFSTNSNILHIYNHDLKGYIDYIVLKANGNTNLDILYPSTINYGRTLYANVTYTDHIYISGSRAADKPFEEYSVSTQNENIKIEFTYYPIKGTIEDFRRSPLNNTNFLPTMYGFGISGIQLVSYTQEPPYVVRLIAVPNSFTFNKDKPQYAKLMYLMSDMSYVSYDGNDSGYVYKDNNWQSKDRIKIAYYTINKDLLTVYPLKKGQGDILIPYNNYNNYDFKVTNNIQADGFDVSIDGHKYSTGGLSYAFKSYETTYYTLKSVYDWWSWNHWKYKAGLSHKDPPKWDWDYEWGPECDDKKSAIENTPIDDISIKITRGSKSPYVRVILQYKYNNYSKDYYPHNVSYTYKVVVDKDNTTVVVHPDNWVYSVFFSIFRYGNGVGRVNYEIQISDDKTAWTTISSGTALIYFGQ